MLYLPLYYLADSVRFRYSLCEANLQTIGNKVPFISRFAVGVVNLRTATYAMSELWKPKTNNNKKDGASMWSVRYRSVSGWYVVGKPDQCVHYYPTQWPQLRLRHQDLSMWSPAIPTLKLLVPGWYVVNVWSVNLINLFTNGPTQWSQLGLDVKPSLSWVQQPLFWSCRYLVGMWLVRGQ